MSIGTENFLPIHVGQGLKINPDADSTGHGQSESTGPMFLKGERQNQEIV
jgi:hypothetical protein